MEYVMRKDRYVVLCIVMIGMLLPVSGSAFSLFSRYSDVEIKEGEVRLALSKVSDGKAHYYSVQVHDKTIKFFIVRSSDGVIRAAFDACDVCFAKKMGYSQEGEFMICNNCGRKFHSSRVNVVEGGCNPAPLRRQEVGEYVVIKEADFLPGARFF